MYGARADLLLNRTINELMLLHWRQAGESFAHHRDFEFAALAGHMRLRAGDALFDELFNCFGCHELVSIAATI